MIAAPGEQQSLDQLAAYALQALDLKPDWPEAHYNLGIALGAQGRLDEAIACYRKALGFKPDFSEAHTNLGITLEQQGRLDEALDCYRRASRIIPDDPNACCNLGLALAKQMRLDEAVECFRSSLVHQPDQPEVHNNLAIILLALGELAAGWKEYEWRWKTLQTADRLRKFAQPQWMGETLQGGTLLIHAEQGFGDTFNSAVTLRCSPPEGCG